MATRPSAQTRAKDSDRDATCQALDTALGDGQLSMEEHRERVAAATSAKSLGDLSALVADLQLNTPPVALPHERKPSAWRQRAPFLAIAAFTAAVVVLGIGLLVRESRTPDTPRPAGTPGAVRPGAAPVDDGIAPTVIPRTAPAEKNIFSAPGLSTLIDRIHQKFGDSTGYELDLYPEYAIIERADPDEPKGLISYLYREGDFNDPDRRPRSFDNLGDVGAFDQAAILGIIRGAAQTLGIDRGEPSHVIIRPTAEGGLKINIYASRGNYESGYISVDAQGLNPKLHPPS